MSFPSQESLDGFWLAETRDHLELVTQDLLNSFTSIVPNFVQLPVPLLHIDLSKSKLYIFNSDMTNAMPNSKVYDRYFVNSLSVSTVSSPQNALRIVITNDYNPSIQLTYDVVFSTDQKLMYLYLPDSDTINGDKGRLIIYRRLDQIPEGINDSSSVKAGDKESIVKMFIKSTLLAEIPWVSNDISATLDDHRFNYDHVIERAMHTVHKGAHYHSHDDVHDMKWAFSPFSSNFQLVAIDTREKLHINPYTKIHISKLKGEWSVLNGEVRLFFIGNKNTILPTSNGTDNGLYRYVLEVSNIYTGPPLCKWDPCKHGQPRIKYSYESIHSSTEFRDLIATIGYINDLSGPTQYNDIFYLINLYPNYSIPETFVDYINILIGNTGLLVPHGSERFGPDASGKYYYFLQNTDIIRNLDSFDFTKTFEPEYLISYDIDINYMDFPTYKTPYFTISGPITKPIHSTLTSIGYPNNGSQFDFAIFDEATYNPGYLPVVIPYSGFIGIEMNKIKPSLVSGKNVGYLRINGMNSGDPYMFMDNYNFCQNDKLDNYHRMFSQVMQYYDGCDDVIIDLRGCDKVYYNEDFCAAFAAAFGANRRGYYKNLLRTGTGFTVSPTHLQDYVDPNLAFDRDDNRETVDVTYANSVGGFTLTHTRILLLLGKSSRSITPLFVSLMMGDAGDKKIGCGVCVKIIGDLDTRIYGEPSGACPIQHGNEFSGPVIGYSYPSLLSYSPTYYTRDLKNVFGYHAFTTITGPVLPPNIRGYSSIFDTYMTPDVIVDFSWCQFDSDIGIIPPNRSYIMGPPDRFDFTTWSDIGIEKCLENL